MAISKKSYADLFDEENPKLRDAKHKILLFSKWMK
jgi:hypothetical protein